MNKYSDIEIQTAKNLLKEGYKWIARTFQGSVGAFSCKPCKRGGCWFYPSNLACTTGKTVTVSGKFTPLFQSIKWADNEPTYIEDIIKSQILEDAEKRYLEGVIRPFKDKAKRLTKTMKFHPYKCGRDPILTGYKVSQYPDWIDIEMQDGKTVRYKRYEERLMIVMRRVKIEVNRPKIGDRIRVDHYTATCQKITPNGALFFLDQYLDKAFPMNWNDTNEGGYEKSYLRKALQSDEVLNIFSDIRDYMVPFDNGDLLRLPFAGELFDKLPSWCEPDDHKQWPLMQDRRNRLASRCGEYEWGWINNKRKSSATSFCYVSGGGCANSWNASYVFGVRPAFLIAYEPIIEN